MHIVAEQFRKTAPKGTLFSEKKKSQPSEATEDGMENLEVEALDQQTLEQPNHDGENSDRSSDDDSNLSNSSSKTRFLAKTLFVT